MSKIPVQRLKYSIALFYVAAVIALLLFDVANMRLECLFSGRDRLNAWDLKNIVSDSIAIQEYVDCTDSLHVYAGPPPVEWWDISILLRNSFGPCRIVKHDAAASVTSDDQILIHESHPDFLKFSDSTGYTLINQGVLKLWIKNRPQN